MKSVHPDKIQLIQSSVLQTFYQNLFTRILRKMERGVLTVIFPDGARTQFGLGVEGPRAQMTILNPRFFQRFIFSADIGFGESYVDGDWETEDISQVLSWFIFNLDQCPSFSGTERKSWLVNCARPWNRILHFLRRNNVQGSQKNIQDHYDLGNDFFRIFLDPGLIYSCAYFKSPDLTLEEAQRAKMESLCKKLRLRPTDHLLEIGSGWGGFSLHAAKNYGCRVTTVTISRKQALFAAQRIQAEGCENRIEVQLKDYRHLCGRYDKIVSIEMIEAVGDKYLETFFQKCHALLKKEGLLGLQMILSPDSRYEEFKKGIDWIQKHIFPGSLLPSVGRIQKAIERTGDLSLYSLEDMGTSYVKTLTFWTKSFNDHLQEVRSLGFDEEFIRKWNYYLAYCKAAFSARNITVAQAVYSRPNNPLLFQSYP